MLLAYKAIKEQCPRCATNTLGNVCSVVAEDLQSQ